MIRTGELIPAGLLWVCVACEGTAMAALPTLRASIPSMGWAYDVEATHTEIRIHMRPMNCVLRGEPQGRFMDPPGPAAWPDCGLPRLPLIVLVFDMTGEEEYELTWSAESADDQTVEALAPVETPVVTFMSEAGFQVSRQSVPNPAVYQKDACWPETLVKMDRAVGAGSRFIRIEVSPYQYNPVRGLLRSHRDIRLRLTKKEIR